MLGQVEVRKPVLLSLYCAHPCHFYIILTAFSKEVIAVLQKKQKKLESSVTCSRSCKSS
jgi:hypothetical protein